MTRQCSIGRVACVMPDTSMTASLMAGAQIQTNHDVAEQNRSSEPPLRFLRSTPGGNSSVQDALTVPLGGGRSPLAFRREASAITDDRLPCVQRLHTNADRSW